MTSVIMPNVCYYHSDNGLNTYVWLSLRKRLQTKYFTANMATFYVNIKRKEDKIRSLQIYNQCIRLRF